MGWTRNMQNWVNSRIMVAGYYFPNAGTYWPLDDSNVIMLRNQSGDRCFPYCFTDAGAYSYYDEGGLYPFLTYDPESISTYNNTQTKLSSDGFYMGSGSPKKQRGAFTIMLGSGDTPENFDDYKLANSISASKFSPNTGLTIKAKVEDNADVTLTIDQANFQATEDLIVKEFGIFKAYNVTPNPNSGLLIYRKVLDTPISMTANTPTTLKLSFTIPAIKFAQS